MDINNFLSADAKNMKPSPIRELLSMVNKPGMISFAGGFPNPLSFPIPEIKEIMNEVLEEQGVQALQYGGTDGNRKLREEISKRYIKQGLDIDADNIIITTASQQAIDLTARIFLDAGDTVVVGWKVIEGKRERVQDFEGIVTKIQNAGIGKNFTVRKLSSGIGVERTFPMNSPKIEYVKVARMGKVRRAKLNYLKDLVSQPKIKERRAKQDKAA